MKYKNAGENHKKIFINVQVKISELVSQKYWKATAIISRSWQNNIYKGKLNMIAAIVDSKATI